MPTKNLLTVSEIMYLSALDLVGALDEISDKRKKELIDWIYSLQVKPDDEHGFSRCGFFGWLLIYIFMIFNVFGL